MIALGYAIVLLLAQRTGESTMALSVTQWLGWHFFDAIALFLAPIVKQIHAKI